MFPNYISELLKAYFEMSSEDRRKILDERYFDTNPLTCPKEYLPYLALEIGVNIDELNEKEARVVIEKAIKANLIKGTTSAIKNVLNVELKEWFEYDGEPYKFKIKFKSADNEKKWINAYKSILQNKNVRSVLDSIGIDTQINFTIYRATVFKTGQKANIYLKINPEIRDTGINCGLTRRYALKISIGVNTPELHIANTTKYFGGGVRLANKQIIGVTNG